MEDSGRPSKRAKLSKDVGGDGDDDDDDGDQHDKGDEPAKASDLYLDTARSPSLTFSTTLTPRT